jgi:hypothetical protein
MQEKMKFIRIFIGSPGGLDEERKAARAVFEEINLSHGEKWGLHFKIVAWEDTIPGYQRAQSKINEDLDHCEYFIGVLHDRWGSPPSNAPNGYSSGFEEEFFRAEKAIKSGKMKDMALFFKTINTHDGFVPGPAIQKVMAFRKEQVEGKVNYFRDYNTLEDFKSGIRNKLNEIGWNESGLAEVNQKDDASQPELTPTEHVDTESGSRSALFDIEARNFLCDLLNKPDDWESTQPFEAARLRLIAASISRSGNDEVTLGNHDANLIFMHLRDITLSEREYDTLIDTGVVGFEQCNVPLWRWLARKKVHDHLPYFRLRLLATVGTDDEKLRAIQLLHTLEQPIPTHDSDFNIHIVLQTWFSEGTNDKVFNAAVSFLNKNAKMDDLTAIEQAQEKAPANRKSKIEAAIIGIIAQHSIENALKRVCKNNVDKLDMGTVQHLFGSPASIATKNLVDCLSAKPDDIRLSAAQILYNRKEISIDLANTLLTDSNHDIRLVAVEALQQHGKGLKEELVKKVLTFERTTSGLFSVGKKETDTSVYEEYRRNRLVELTELDLRQAMEEVPFIQQRELEVLYTKFGSKKHVIAELRYNLEDGFKKHIQSALERVESRHEGFRSFFENDSDWYLSYRMGLCSDAVSALCAIRKSVDLSLVRRTLDEFPIKASKNLLDYLSRFGDWADIDRINNLTSSRSKRSSLLGTDPTSYSYQRASAILALGKHRLADLLISDLENSVRHELLQLMPQKSIIELSDDIILRELYNEDDKSRIIFALRCVQALPRTRTKSILQKYFENEKYRFYNSIHWLDLGASFPTRQAKQIASRELARRYM